MTKSIWIKLCCATVVAAFCFVPGAFADTATLNLTGVSGGTLGGVFTSPYIATVDGVSNVYVICDDFADDTYVNEQWTTAVTTYTVNDLSGISKPPVYFSDGYSVTLSSSTYSLGGASLTQTQAYTTAAILAIEILQAKQQGNQTAQNYLSYALWSLFDGSTPLTGKPGLQSNTTYVQNALSYLYAAEQSALSGNLSAYADATITIYDYNGGGVTGCGGCAPPPQEFLSVRMIEPSELAALTLDLLGVAGLIAFVARRRKPSLIA